MHSEIAEQMYTIYITITIIYIIKIIIQKNYIKYYKDIQEKLDTILSSRIVKICIVLLSLCGFVLLSITGALGAAITHGPDIDPIVQFIYNLFL